MAHLAAWRAAFVGAATLTAALAASAAAASEPAASTAAEDADHVDAAVEAEPIDAAVDFAKRLTDDATTALTGENASEAEKLDDFQTVLADGLALETIGKFMLGEARKTMSDAQRERYNAAFPEYITRQYAEQFEGIVGRPLEVVDAKEISKRDVIVRTRFSRDDGDPINVDWRIRRLKSGERKAIDIIVSGVSIMLVKRDEFSAYIEQNGLDALLDRIEAEATA